MNANIIEGSEIVTTDPKSPAFEKKCLQAIREGSPYPQPPKEVLDIIPERQIDILIRLNFREVE